MQLDRAMWYAAKPEFGILSKEMELASKRVFGGETLDEALHKLSERFKSRYLARTVELIKEGIGSGGEIAVRLEKTATDLRNLQLYAERGWRIYDHVLDFHRIQRGRAGAPWSYTPCQSNS